MNILFQLGHPAHFHLFKNTIADLRRDGHNVVVVIKKKDILEELLREAHMPYTNILPSGKRTRAALLARLVRLARIGLQSKADVLVGSTPDVAIIGRLLGRRSLVTVEDDASVISRFVRDIRPFVDCCATPLSCNLGPLEPHTTHYAGFQKLAYLHPARFQADPTVVRRYLGDTKRYFILRFAQLTAYHDISASASGIDDRLATDLVGQLEPHGRVCVSSERPLPAALEPYRLAINPLDMHHLLAGASLYVGDSQSMAVEAAVLGVPSLRFSNFVGKIGVLEELEHTYHLTTGIPCNEPGRLLSEARLMAQDATLKETYAARRQQMLADKIDVASFLTDFIEHLTPRHGLHH